MSKKSVNPKKIVVFTGAGISAESGLKTFRDSDGLWESYPVDVVASISGWQNDPQLVLEFFNQRRKDAAKAQPNRAHLAIAELESMFEVVVVTQNIDSLHERSGSTKVIHLHGSLNQARSSIDPAVVYDIGDSAIQFGQECELKSQLRPNVVFLVKCRFIWMRPKSTLRRLHACWQWGRLWWWSRPHRCLKRQDLMQPKYW